MGNSIGFHLMCRIHFIPQKAESANDGDESPDLPQKRSFELEPRPRLRWKRVPTGGHERLVTGDAPPPNRDGCCGKKTPSLVMALGKTFFKTIAAQFALKFIQDILTFASPQLLK